LTLGGSGTTTGALGVGAGLGTGAGLGGSGSGLGGSGSGSGGGGAASRGAVSQISASTVVGVRLCHDTPIHRKASSAKCTNSDSITERH